MMKKYWENEAPLEADTGKNIIRLFKEAGRLQVAMPHWTDKDGQQCRGKTVTMDIAALLETPEAMEILRSIVSG